jgi:hypothetical protein
MGAILEIAKITTTVWLHNHWHRAGILIKIYLTIAVIILAMLTSMGIFGLLSKAHVEQTGDAAAATALVSRVDLEIGRQNEIIARSRERITQLENSGTGQSAQAQREIDREQTRIDQVIARTEPLIREQQAIIDRLSRVDSTRLGEIDSLLNKLQTALNIGDVSSVQRQIGVTADGQLGPQTQRAIQSYRSTLESERNSIKAATAAAQNSDQLKSASVELQRIRRNLEEQVSSSNQVINRLREQIGVGAAANIDSLVAEQIGRAHV